ncbi:MAG: hypothetical protein K6G91_01555 [Kiritimatiellae bacterium]|nr:hypothetical protein [Kiritimatiellia bacterium]
MKQIIVIALTAVAWTVAAGFSRERGSELLRKFENCTEGSVVTNKTECIRTVNDEAGVCQFWYDVGSTALRHVRIQRGDGGVDIYDYRDGKLYSACSTTTNLMSMVTAIYIGDGKGTNVVDRMEFDSVNGKVVGPLRFLDANGKRVACPLPTKTSSIDKEYIPRPGMTGKIGPYEWTIVDKHRTGVLSHNGKKLIESHFCIGGRYPWLVGFGYEESAAAKRKELLDRGIRPKDEYSGVDYYFAIDMRDDHIEYIPFEERDEISRITGMSDKSYDLKGFWSYFLSKRGSERLAKLEAALTRTRRRP